MNIGRTIKLIRQVAGLTQEQMAERLDIASNYMSLLENDKATPKLSLLRPYKEPRDIRVTVDALALVQRRPLDRVFAEFKPHECSYGGVKGRTVVEYASSHCNKLFVLKIDVRKFYPNIHHRWVQAFFE